MRMKSSLEQQPSLRTNHLPDIQQTKKTDNRRYITDRSTLNTVCIQALLQAHSCGYLLFNFSFVLLNELFFFCLCKIWLFYCCDCILLHRNSTIAVITKLYNHCIIHDINNHTIKSACS